MMPYKNSYFAQNVKDFRTKRGHTQQEFAAIAGIARSTYTNIESGEANPSLSNVVKIAQALDVTVDLLLSKPRAQTTLLKKKDLVKEIRGVGVEITKLLVDNFKEVSIDKVKITPGDVFRGKPHLNGTKEYLTVIEGEVEVVISGQRYKVVKDEVLAFPGDVNHSYRNIGIEDLVYMSIVIPS
ncbi:MAG: helix-turn-helix domain-containing protein [Bacteriovoracaceae bacterium]|jgi:transcriptional regulator with XRE-family HTH domain|nr:helix-turn-helix domain-containing protein [Bacteriovoracaceae bacterium]